jgi:hypothetical protein
MRAHIAFVTVCLAGAPAVAHAGDAADTAADGLGNFASEVRLLRERPAQRHHASLEPGSACTKIIAAARKAGLGDDARLFSSYFYGLDETHFDENQQAYLTLAEGAALCDEYASWLPFVPVAAAFEDAKQKVDIYSTMVEAGELGKDVGASLAKSGQECAAQVDAAIAAGADESRSFAVTDATTITTLSAGRKEYCETLIAFGKKLGVEVKQAHDARAKEIAAKYTKHGVKGAKLELFVEYDGTYWRGKRCEIVDDVKKLAKAKKLYQWLEHSDGSITIRRYDFKGNKIKKVTDKAFWSQAKAAAYCK